MKMVTEKHLWDVTPGWDREKVRGSLTPDEIDELLEFYIISYDEQTGGRKVPIAPLRKKLQKLIGDV